MNVTAWAKTTTKLALQVIPASTYPHEACTVIDEVQAWYLFLKERERLRGRFQVVHLNKRYNIYVLTSYASNLVTIIVVYSGTVVCVVALGLRGQGNWRGTWIGLYAEEWFRPTGLREIAREQSVFPNNKILLVPSSKSYAKNLEF